MARFRSEAIFAVLALVGAVALGGWALSVIARFNQGWDAITEGVVRVGRLETVRLAILESASQSAETAPIPPPDARSRAVEAVEALIGEWSALRADPPPPSLQRFASEARAPTSDALAESAVAAALALHLAISEERARTSAIAARQRGLWAHVEIMALVVALLGLAAILALVALRRAIRASHENRRRLEDVASNLPGIVYRAVLSKERPLRLEYISQGVERIYGIPREQILKDPSEAMRRIVPEDLELLGYAQRRILETGEADDIEFRIIDGRNRLRWMQRAASVARLPGGDIAIDAVLIDITALKQAEAALAASEQRYRNLVEASPDGVIVHRDMRVLYANAAAARALAAGSPEALVGADILGLVHPDQREFVRSRVAAVYENGVFKPAAEERLIRLDGSQFFAEVQTAPCVFDGLPGGQSVIRDITDRRRQEERLGFLNRELQHRVKNNLATIQALVDQTARYATTVEEHREAVVSRIQAMARTTDLMHKVGDRPLPLLELLQRTLETYIRRDAGVRLQGPADLCLGARGAEVLNRVINELAANAAKHGALSCREGRVDLTWSVDTSGEVHIVWAESGGTPIDAPPTRRGFGAELIEGSIPHELGGRVKWSPMPHGLTCEIDLPPAVFIPNAPSGTPAA